MDRETARVAAEANAEGQIKVERENEEIHLRAQKEKIETQRVSDMELLKEKLLFWKELSSNAMNTLTDPQKMTVIGSVLCVFVCTCVFVCHVCVCGKCGLL